MGDHGENLGAAGGLSRRELAGRAAFFGAGLALGGAVPGWARKRPPLLREGRFSSGVIAGFPGRHGAHLWTRVADAGRGGEVTLELAHDRGFERLIESRRVSVDPDRDFTARAHVAGLDPGHEYYYRFATRDRSSRVGRFRTRRPADSREPVRIGFFSCQGWQAGYFTAHAGLADEDLDLVISLGDYIYELTDDDGPREDRIGPDRDGEAQTLAEYRQKYHLYQSDLNLQAMHAAHGFACVWDDHELESGWMGPHEGDTQGRDRRVPYPKRVRNGMRAFYEHLPVPRLASDPTRIYRSIELGRDAELILLDLHQYGDGYACSFQLPPRPCPEADDPGRSVLGARQKRWLKQRLARSPRTWKLVGNSFMMMSLDLAPGLPFNPGQWDGFAWEREELMRHVIDREIDGVAVFTGDIHTFFAGQLTTDGRVTGVPAATEFVAGSISSEGISQGVAEALGLPEDTPDGVLTDQVTLLNPHMRYANTSRRGYAVAEASAEELRVDFRSPDTVYAPRSDIVTLASFRVEPNRPNVEPI